jgi:hypothetical protein
VATYNVPRGQVAVHDKTLVANTADTITFADEAGSVEVWADGTAAVFVSTTGSPATVGGGDAYELEAGAASSKVLPVGGRTVSVISSGAAKYSVTRTA